MEKEDINIYVNKEGSELSKDYYLLRVDQVLEAPFSLLVSSLASPKDRQNFDSEIEHVEQLSYEEEPF